MKQAPSVRCRRCHPLERQGLLGSFHHRTWLIDKASPDKVASKPKHPSCVMNLAALTGIFDARMSPREKLLAPHQHHTMVCATTSHVTSSSIRSGVHLDTLNSQAHQHGHWNSFLLQLLNINSAWETVRTSILITQTGHVILELTTRISAARRHPGQTNFLTWANSQHRATDDLGALSLGYGFSYSLWVANFRLHWKIVASGVPRTVCYFSW